MTVKFAILGSGRIATQKLLPALNRTRDAGAQRPG